MATIRRNRETLVFLSGDRFIAATKCGVEEIQIPEAAKEQKDEEKPTSKADDRSGNKNCILASAFSASGKYFAVGDDRKQLHVYKVSPNWELVSSRLVARRCTAITFPQNEKEVVVADRTGDVYKFSLIDTDSNGELILGHLSMILDVVISSDDKYIITCDRDEKVRISHYPNAYNIHAFCLLHTEYVSQVLYLKDFNCLVSGSGDGTLACWTMEGKNLCNTNTVKLDSLQGQGETIPSENGEVAMVTDNTSGGEGQEEVEGQTDPAGVKKLIYNQELNIIAVIFHRSKQLNFYTTEKHENGCTLLENTHNALTEEPWDICFDDNHRVWILQPCEQKPVLVLKCSKDNLGKIQVNDCVSDDSVQQTQNALHDRWNFFQASVDCQTQLISLQKVRTFESVHVQRYLEKKEERINSQKNKQQPPPQKKLKTS